ncbi:MAG TPA: GntR family transcriptional regulator [Chloroflexota bacterium]
MLNEAAYQAIKRRIINLDMPPGMPFTEGQLAAELSLSKTPVRDALGWLQREGLVELPARCRYRVAPVTLNDVRDWFSLRILLEGEAARLAAQGTDAGQLQALVELSKIGYDPRDPASITQFLSANTRFHAIIARAGGNKRLAAALEQVLDHMERLYYLGLALTSRSDEIVREHQDLVRAIMRGDEGLAREVVVAHTHASQIMVIDSLLSNKELLSTNLTTPARKMSGLMLARVGPDL